MEEEAKLTAMGNRQVLHTIHANDAVEAGQLYVVFPILLAVGTIRWDLSLVHQVNNIWTCRVAEKVIVVEIRFSLSLGC